MSDSDRINVMISRELHQALVETQPYEENLQQWADYVVSEGLHAVEAQREEDQ